MIWREIVVHGRVFDANCEIGVAVSERSRTALSLRG